MTERSIDRFTRAFASVSRRQTLAGVAAGVVSLVRGGDPSVAGDTCPRRKRCGQECCRDCFEKKDPNTGKRVRLLCCKASRLCQGLSGPDSDQCCYGDETCQNGSCCRTCPDPSRNGCCEFSEFCNNADLCESLGTARLPRFRR